MIISLIAAVSENNVIGSNKDLPWRLPRDMKFFKDTTTGHHVLMGRKTYESFPNNFRPLPGRTNIVITRKKDYDSENIHVFNNISDGIKFAEKEGEEELFIIGGGSVYREVIDNADRLYITRIHEKFDGDTYFPEIKSEEWKLDKTEKHKADENNPYDFSFLIYVRRRG